MIMRASCSSAARRRVQRHRLVPMARAAISTAPGTDTGDIPDVLGNWTSSFGDRDLRRGLRHRRIDARHRDWIARRSRSRAALPSALLEFEASRTASAFWGVMDEHGGVTFTGQPPHQPRAPMDVSFGGLVYHDHDLDRDAHRRLRLPRRRQDGRRLHRLPRSAAAGTAYKSGSELRRPPIVPVTRASRRRLPPVASSSPTTPRSAPALTVHRLADDPVDRRAATRSPSRAQPARDAPGSSRCPGEPVPERFRPADRARRRAALARRAAAARAIARRRRATSTRCATPAAAGSTPAIKGYDPDRLRRTIAEADRTFPPSDARWDAVVVAALLERAARPAHAGRRAAQGRRASHLHARSAAIRTRWALALQVARLVGLVRPAEGRLRGFPEAVPRPLGDPTRALRGSRSRSTAAAILLRAARRPTGSTLDAFLERLRVRCREILCSPTDGRYADRSAVAFDDAGWEQRRGRRCSAAWPTRSTAPAWSTRAAPAPTSRRAPPRRPARASRPGFVLLPDGNLLVHSGELSSTEYGRLARLAPYVDGERMHRHRLTREGVAARSRRRPPRHARLPRAATPARACRPTSSTPCANGSARPRASPCSPGVDVAGGRRRPALASRRRARRGARHRLRQAAARALPLPQGPRHDPRRVGRPRRARRGRAHRALRRPRGRRAHLHPRAPRSTPTCPRCIARLAEPYGGELPGEIEALVVSGTGVTAAGARRARLARAPARRGRRGACAATGSPGRSCAAPSRPRRSSCRRGPRPPARAAARARDPVAGSVRSEEVGAIDRVLRRAWGDPTSSDSDCGGVRARASGPSRGSASAWRSPSPRRSRASCGTPPCSWAPTGSRPRCRSSRASPSGWTTRSRASRPCSTTCRRHAANLRALAIVGLDREPRARVPPGRVGGVAARVPLPLVRERWHDLLHLPVGRAHRRDARAPAASGAGATRPLVRVVAPLPPQPPKRPRQGALERRLDLAPGHGRLLGDRAAADPASVVGRPLPR